MSENVQPDTIRWLMREPLVHFFLMALIIFALYGLSNRTQTVLLELDQADIDGRLFMQEMATGQALSEEQREYFTAAFVEEQILVQEALKMGLDDDARIYDILAQKMRHVLSGDIIQPSEAELEAFYQANLERYRTLPTLDTDEIVFNSREALPAELLAQLAAGAEAESLLPQSPGNLDPLPNVNRLDLSNIFDEPFAEQVFTADIGPWQGPFRSNRGQHWLQVKSRTESVLPSLAEIRDRVRLEWIAMEEDQRLQIEIEQLWEQYTIRILNDNSVH
jgi:parvulin-like peptidyl-prolyl isomerase